MLVETGEIHDVKQTQNKVKQIIMNLLTFMKRILQLLIMKHYWRH